MGMFRSLLLLVMGAAGGAAAVLLRQNSADTSPSPYAMRGAVPGDLPGWLANEPAQSGSVQAAAPAVDTIEFDQWKDRAQAAQAQVAEQERSLNALRDELAASRAWQAKVPTLARFGQTLARLPSYKAAATDAAIGAMQLPAVTAACQDLATVNGIGATYEQRLYNAGVGTFWEVANLPDEDFLRMFNPTALQRAALDLAAIRVDANRLAVETGTVGLLWEGAPPDDFERIKGIGKVFEQRLYDAGIRTYRALASATADELAAVCQGKGNTPVRPDFAGWIAQAQKLLAE